MKQPVNQEIEKVAETLIQCDACKWLRISNTPELFVRLDVTEKKAVQLAVDNGYNILPGTPYIEEHGVYKDKPYISNYVKAIHEICLKYELYSYVGNKPKLF